MSATLLELCGITVPDYFQGRSLLPVLQGDEPGTHIRDFVRCEYFEALDPFFSGGPGSYATMYRDEQHKLSLYHDQQLGELYDLKQDPWEFEDLWDDTASAAVKADLILKSFHAHVMTSTDVGTRRNAPM